MTKPRPGGSALRARHDWVQRVYGLVVGIALLSASRVTNAAQAAAPMDGERGGGAPRAETSRGVSRPDRRALVAAQYATRHAVGEARPSVAELTIPHGLTDRGKRAGLFAVVGGLLPLTADAPAVMTALLALEYQPFLWAVAPFIDVGAGGYLVLGRGADRAAAPRLEWLWASGASAGLKLNLQRMSSVPVSVRAFGHAFWVEQPHVPLASVFPGWGLGLGVEYRFAVPDVHLVRQFSHGEGMADGW